MLLTIFLAACPFGAVSHIRWIFFAVAFSRDPQVSRSRVLLEQS
jgi:hypothetical protein